MTSSHQVHESDTLPRTDDSSLAPSCRNTYSLFVIRRCACKCVAGLFHVACPHHRYDCNIHRHGWLYAIIHHLRHLFSTALYPRPPTGRFGPDGLPPPWPNWPSRVCCPPHRSKPQRAIANQILSKFSIHVPSVAIHGTSFICALPRCCVLAMDFGDHVFVLWSPRHRIDAAEDAYRIHA